MPFSGADECPAYGTYPSVEDFNKGLGGFAIGLYVYSGLVISVLAVQYGFLAGHFFAHVPQSRQVATFWINSIYLVVAVFTMCSIVLPQSSDFVWLFYRVYLGMAMGYFVTLTMAWYGGEGSMLEGVGAETLVNFRIRPWCCCLCCPGAAHLTKRRIRFMKAAVYQMPYVQGTVLFLMAVLNLAGYLEAGSLNPAGPYLYLILLLTVSFFFGIWGLFLFFDITKRYRLLLHYQYRKKSYLIKAMVIFVNVQGVIIDILAQYGVIKCVAPFISSSAMGAVIKCMLALTESLILGSFCYRLYITDNTHL